MYANVCIVSQTGHGQKSESVRTLGQILTDLINSITTDRELNLRQNS